VWEVPATKFPARVTDLAMGRAHCLFVLETGELFSCGSNFHGQCGWLKSIAEPGPEPELDTAVPLKLDSAEQPQSIEGYPIKAGDKLKCATSALARTDADMASERSCYLSKGTRITALEVRQLADGTERVRFDNGAVSHGWVSRKSCANVEERSERNDILVSDDGVETPDDSLRIDGADNEQVKAL
jgi:hypothetical protein